MASQTFQLVHWQVGGVFHNVQSKEMHDAFVHKPAVLQCPSSSNLSSPLFSCGRSAYIQASFSRHPWKRVVDLSNHQPPITVVNTCVKHNLPEKIPNLLALSPIWCQPDPVLEPATTHRCSQRTFIGRHGDGQRC